MKGCVLTVNVMKKKWYMIKCSLQKKEGSYFVYSRKSKTQPPGYLCRKLVPWTTRQGTTMLYVSSLLRLTWLFRVYESRIVA